MLSESLVSDDESTRSLTKNIYLNKLSSVRLQSSTGFRFFVWYLLCRIAFRGVFCNTFIGLQSEASGILLLSFAT